MTEQTDGPCQSCGVGYPAWFAPHEVWNRVMGGPDATDDPGGLLCPLCFVRKAADCGVRPLWQLAPERPAEWERELLADHGSCPDCGCPIEAHQPACQCERRCSRYDPVPGDEMHWSPEEGLGEHIEALIRANRGSSSRAKRRFVAEVAALVSLATEQPSGGQR